MGKLTALKVKNAKPGKHGDGDGLYLVVSDSLPSSSMSGPIQICISSARTDTPSRASQYGHSYRLTGSRFPPPSWVL